MKVIIKNCNNIKEGCIDLVPNKLNIKYGVNGTGKSTISTALTRKINNESLDSLKPFNTEDNIIPSISGCESFNSIKVYNDEYVSKFLFLPNEDGLHQNSFEVFIKPKDYDMQIKQINDILGIVKDYVIQNEIINNLINQRNELNKIIKLNTKKTSINSIGVGRALAVGNKIISVPEELNKYSENLHRNDKAKWYSWQSEGRTYIIDNKCPFCTSRLENNFAEVMKLLDELFNRKDVENLLKVENIINNISSIITEDTKTFIFQVLNNEEPIADETKEKIAQFIIELDDICNKLTIFLQLDYSSLKSVENLEQMLEECKLDLNNYLFIGGEDFINIINNLNNKIDEMSSNVKSLKKNISILNSSVNGYANKNKQRINDFLDTIGMEYEVNVRNNRLLLFYKSTDIIVDVNSHLSWGERNAFALSLFLFDCLHDNPDLIILDDPVSSFDLNKKYAITYYLFNQKDSLQGKTVLMLTHDLEPIINLVKVKKYPFIQSNYIENKKGIVSENVILEDDIESIFNVTRANFNDVNLNIINRIVHLRRYLELNSEYEYEYNMISSLLKGYFNPIYKNKRTEREFTEEEFNKTEDNLKKFINDFDYNSILMTIIDKSKMKQLYLDTKNNYEKTEIFRIILKTFKLHNVNPVIKEFLNEEFHIENTYIFQLDPYAYNLVPNYIVEMCDSIINRMTIDGLVTN